MFLKQKYSLICEPLTNIYLNYSNFI